MLPRVPALDSVATVKSSTNRYPRGAVLRTYQKSSPESVTFQELLSRGAGAEERTTSLLLVSPKVDLYMIQEARCQYPIRVITNGSVGIDKENLRVEESVARLHCKLAVVRSLFLDAVLPMCSLHQLMHLDTVRSNFQPVFDWLSRVGTSPIYIGDPT